MIRSIAIVVSLLLLVGCASPVVDTSCTAFMPLTYSAANDTPETKAQIRGHNAAWDRLCK
jgi:hypothetical protein